MPYLGLGYPFLLVSVAVETEVHGAVGCEIVLIVCRVRAMAVCAVLLYGFVHEFFPLKSFGLIRVALETYIVARGIQHPGEVRLVGIMTHGAAADRNRAMDKFEREEFLVMTYETEVRSIGPELVLVGRLMRIVAESAVAVLYGFVDRSLCIDLVMAFVTQIGRSFYGSEFMLSFCLVTCAAIADCDRTVHELFLPHGAVALISNARFRCIGSAGIKRYAYKQDKKYNRNRNRRSPHHTLLRYFFCQVR
jgi:hypothetical protein